MGFFNIGTFPGSFTPPNPPNAILQEDGAYILLEDDVSRIKLEQYP